MNWIKANLINKKYFNRDKKVKETDTGKIDLKREILKRERSDLVRYNFTLKRKRRFKVASVL